MTRRPPLMPVVLPAAAVVAALALAVAGAFAQPPTGMSTGAQAHMPPPAAPANPADAPTGPPSTVDVFVSGQGVAIPDVKVTLAPDAGRPAEQWNSGDSKALGVTSTDATGHAHFKDVPPGRYIVTTGCGITGNWIAGNYASRLEAFAGRAIAVTLTMRRGGMVRGTAMQGDHPVKRCDLRADSPDAMMSTCGMMSPSLVDTTTGGFTIAKVPLGVNMWIKASLDFGIGQLGVWKAVSMAKPETLDVQVQFPTLAAKDLGTLVIKFRPDTPAVTDSGTAALALSQPDGTWRFEASPRIAGVDSVTTIHGLPAGGYQIRPYASVGTGKWWNATMDSVRVTAGKSTVYVVQAHLR